MGFTRFFTSLSGTRLQRCLVDEVLPLKGLIQVGAPDHAAIRDAGNLAVLPHLIRVGVALVQPKNPRCPRKACPTKTVRASSGSRRHAQGSPRAQGLHETLYEPQRQTTLALPSR